MPDLPNLSDAMNYGVDAAQRAVLFLDVMRRRAEQYQAQNAEEVPHVLDYQAELMIDGRDLPRPCNYLLVRIKPPEGVQIDKLKRPFVVIDPRAGHGPGIGGFKADSEIGVAMKAGHPCYFIGFLPDPVPGQTIEDVALAEAAFLEAVIAENPASEGKPCVIGNCQAGWAVMLLAAMRPDLFGPIIIAGAPLSYWAGVTGQNPMRYSGGLLGGSWLTALTSDLGAGVFDGSWLVQNFEAQNPANTNWTKQYNLYSKVDTEADRYLGFEKWWGGHVKLNAEEIQFIVDELFIGNKLAAGEIRASDGTGIDLRNIRSPIVVFCSKGDNITPPQQALDWILDLYDDVDDIRAHGQTIVYTVHETVGHLGIFVSAGVAKKEHDEFASNIDLIDVLPPGLYEAVLTPKDADAANPDLVTGNWVMRCEVRTLDDIRNLGGNTAEEDRRFAAAARLSEINLALYRTFLQPLVRASVTPARAEQLQNAHPLRMQYEVFGPANPFMAWVKGAAETVRENRAPVHGDNPLLAWQEQVSSQIVEGWERFRKASEKLAEETFLKTYGNPALQTALGIDPAKGSRRAAKSPLTAELAARRMAELRANISSGGLFEASIRALLYVGMVRQAVDERAFETIRQMRRADNAATLADFKAAVRSQFLTLLLDQDAALAALPKLLPPDEDQRQAALDRLRSVLTASGPLTGEVAKRFGEVEKLFAGGTRPVRAVPSATAQKAS